MSTTGADKLAGSGFDLKRLERVAEFLDRYLDAGKLAGVQVQVAHEGKVALRHTAGMADREEARPLRDDAIFRIYSMTKPITSIALMQLYEKGEVLLEHPVSRFIPEFAESRVWVGGSAQSPQTRPAISEVSVHDVLRHTSGLTYGFFRQHPVDELYRKHGLGDLSLPKITLEEGMKMLAAQPLQFEPGTAWNYGMSTDVSGRIVEVVSGQTLDAYIDEHILEPLGMVDTGFSVDPDSQHRFTTMYARNEGELFAVDRWNDSPYLQPPMLLSGGGGMVSTTDDYQRFCDMLLAGGELDGERIIGRRTLEYMTTNHLPGGRMLSEMGQATFSETTTEGMGFGLGFSVVVDPAQNRAVSSAGEFAWGGAASTAFFVDPVERVTALCMIQFMPSNTFPIRRQLKATVYQALL